MLDKVLAEGEPEAAGLVHGAVEEFAQELAGVLGQFLKRKDWKGTERVAIGGGLRDSRLGELAIGRASVILKAEGHAIELAPIHNHPDEAGLIGAAYLAPTWIFTGHDAILAADIGGSNIRAGLVSLNPKKAADLSAATVAASELWRYRDEKPSREEAVAKLVEMLKTLIGRPEVKAASCSLHRSRLSRRRQRGWFAGGRHAEPARKLGKQSLQSAGADQGSNPRHRRQSDRRDHAQ